MKKPVTIGIAVLIVLTINVFSYADPIAHQKDINIHLPVDSNFGMQIWDDEFEQNLPNTEPGSSTSGDLHIYASSNHATPWTINASSIGLVGETQANPDTLPVKVSTYADGTPLTGTFVNALELTNSAQTIYTAGADEHPCTGLLVGCIFSVTPEPTTKEDIYSGTIVLSMTEL